MKHSRNTRHYYPMERLGTRTLRSFENVDEESFKRCKSA